MFLGPEQQFLEVSRERRDNLGEKILLGVGKAAGRPGLKDPFNPKISMQSTGHFFNAGSSVSR